MAVCHIESQSQIDYICLPSVFSLLVFPTRSFLFQTNEKVDSHEGSHLKKSIFASDINNIQIDNIYSAFLY